MDPGNRDIFVDAMDGGQLLIRYGKGCKPETVAADTAEIAAITGTGHDVRHCDNITENRRYCLLDLAELRRSEIGNRRLKSGVQDLHFNLIFCSLLSDGLKGT